MYALFDFLIIRPDEGYFSRLSFAMSRRLKTTLSQAELGLSELLVMVCVSIHFEHPPTLLWSSSIIIAFPSFILVSFSRKSLAYCHIFVS